MTEFALREPTSAQQDAADALIAAAFPTRAEADLVRALRHQRDLVLELVAIEGDVVVGHVGFSRMTADAGDLRASALAPLAVREDRRRSGVGAALVREGLAQLVVRAEHLVLVLGEPAYYRRFGFAAETAAAFATPYDGPHQQALRLTPSMVAAARLAYAPAVAALG